MNTRYQRFFIIALGFILPMLGLKAFAQVATATDIAGLATNIQAGLAPLINLTIASCYLGGAGFCAASIFKFKAHKDAPTQVPIGTPIMLLFVGVALLFLPSLLTSISATMGLKGTSQAYNFTSGQIIAA